jgi:hypothetical protein
MFLVAPAIDAAGNLTYTLDADASGTAAITITLSDDGGTANGGVDTSAAQSFNINVTDVNDAPSFTPAAGPMVLEDSGAYNAAWATSISKGPSPFEDGQTLTFNVTNNTNPSLFSVAPAIDATTGNLTFTPAADANGTADITVTLSDNGGTANGGVDTSGPQTFTITVTAVNDAPSFTKGADQTVNEGVGPQTVNGWATAISTGPADESGQTLTFNVTGNTSPTMFLVAPAIDAAGNLTYTLDADASGTAAITITLSDDGGTANGGVDTSAAQSFEINVTDINDAPSFTPAAGPTVAEDSGAYNAAWATSISKGPSPFEDGQTLTFNVTSNTNPSLFSVAPAINTTTGNLTFTPTADASGTADITVTLSDDGGTANGGVDTTGPQTFTITVTAVNDPPTANDDSATVDEDSGATAVDVLANDSYLPDPVETLTIIAVTQPAGGTVVITGGGTGLTFQPNANFAGGTTFTYTINDGTPASDATATVTMTVNAVNDAPANTVPGVQTVDQLSTLTFPGNISIADIDAFTPQVTLGVDSGTLTLNGTTGLTITSGANGSATMTFNGTIADINAALNGLVYDPVDTFNAAATLTITTNDLGQTGLGGALQALDTVTINVTALNDPPVNSLPGAQSTNEDATLTLSTGTTNVISISDPDAGASAVQVTLTATNGTMTLAGITGLSFTTGSGTADATMTFTGTIAAINTALDGLQFIPTPNYSGAASIQIVTDDQGNTGSGGAQSDTDPLNITVSEVNDEPSFTASSPSAVNEDAGAQSLVGWATGSVGPPSESAQTLTYTVSNVSNAALFASGPSINASGTLTFTPAANAFGSSTFDVLVQDDGGTANGGDDTSATQTFTITVNSVNDEPSFTAGGNATVLEDSGVFNAAPWATALSAGPTNESAQTLSFVVTNDNNALFSAQPAVDASGNMSFTPATNAFGIATVSVQIQDNGGTANGGDDISAVQNFTITVTGINDEPSFTAANPPAVNEDSGAQTIVGWATGNPGNAAESAQTLTYFVTNVSNGALFSAAPVVSATGQLTYTGALNGFGTSTFDVTVQDNGGTANGGDDTSATQNFTITIIAVNDPPVADNDTFDFVGNTELRVDTAGGTTPKVAETTGTGFGVVDGDSDPVEGDAIAVSGITVGACSDITGPVFDCTDPGVGHVVMQTNGTFTFVPAAGDTGATETFGYTLTDNGSPSPASVNATVTLTRFERVWYVDPGVAGPGAGTSADPYNNLNLLDGVGGAGDSDIAGDYIFVYDGTLALAGPMEMEANQHLIGEGFGLSIPVNLNGNGSPWIGVPVGVKPQLTNATGDAVTVANAIPIEIVGLSLASTTGNSIDLTSAAALTGSATLAIGSNEFRGAGVEGIDVNMNVGTIGVLAINITNNSWNLAGTHTGNAIDVNRAAGTLRLNVSGNTSVLSNATAINIAGGAVASTMITGFANNIVHGTTLGSGVVIGNVTFDSDVVTAGIQQVNGNTLAIGANGNPINLSGLLITTSQGNLFFADLDIYAGSASGTALQLAGTGTGLTFGVTKDLSGGSSIVNSANGPAVDITSATIDLELEDMDSVTATSAVSLSSVGGIFSVPAAGSISKASGGGTAFSVASSAAGTTVSYAGSMNVTSGGGVSLTSNNATSTFTFNGGMTLTTGANAGFVAIGGGTVTVCDEAGCNGAATGGLINTITTTTGTALNVANTTIGANNLEFRSISSNGGTGNGIILDNTGSSGGLKVVGDGTNTSVGGNSSGGTIANKGGADLNFTQGIGIYLNNTRNVVLRRMTVNGTNQNYGIRGNNVNGFVLEYSTVGGTNGTAESLASNENYGEGSIHFGNAVTNGVVGTVTFTNNSISGGRARNLSIVNTAAGTTTLTVKGNTFGAIQPGGGNQSMAVEARVNSGIVINSTVGGTAPGEPNTFTSARADLVNFTGQDQTTMDVVFRNNAVSNNHAGNIIGGGSLTLATKGTMTFNVDGNSFRDAHGSAITLFKASAGVGTPSLSGRFTNNTIGVNGVVGSGSVSGNGIFVSAGGTGTMSFTINNNVIRRINGNGHIYADNTGGSYTANFTIQGNTLDQPGATEAFAIGMTNGSPGSGDTVNVCADIGGSTAAEKNTINVGPALGIVVGSSGANGGHSFNLPGLATFTEAGVETFLTNNNAGAVTVDAYADAPATFAGFTGSGTSCPTP